MISLTAKTNL